MAYGVDKHPDPPDIGVDYDMEGSHQEDEDRRIEDEIDRRRDEDLRAEGR